MRIGFPYFTLSQNLPIEYAANIRFTTTVKLATFHNFDSTKKMWFLLTDKKYKTEGKNMEKTYFERVWGVSKDKFEKKSRNGAISLIENLSSE